MEDLAPVTPLRPLSIHKQRESHRRGMNPSTVLRLWEAFHTTRERKTGLHILEIGGRVGCWPATVYRAYGLGYLDRPNQARFVPSERMRYEVRQAQRNRKS